MFALGGGAGSDSPGSARRDDSDAEPGQRRYRQPARHDDRPGAGGESPVDAALPDRDHVLDRGVVGVGHGRRGAVDLPAFVFPRAIDSCAIVLEER